MSFKGYVWAVSKKGSGTAEFGYTRKKRVARSKARENIKMIVSNTDYEEDDWFYRIKEEQLEECYYCGDLKEKDSICIKCEKLKFDARGNG